MASGKPQAGSAKCPSCGHRLAPKKIHEHTSTCEAWRAEHGDPWPYFKYDPWAKDKKALFADGAVEGVDYIRCQLCAQHGWDFRFSRLAHHIKGHGLDENAYKARFPGAKVRLDKTLRRRIKTTREKYGVDNVFQADGIKEKIRDTMIERYGVEHNNYDPEARAKRAATNVERYGAENPFGSPQIQEQIRETMQERYGAENPQQVPEIKSRTMKTVRERYGADHFVLTAAFREKFRETCQERWGVDHHMKAGSWWKVTGYVSPFADADTQRKSYETNLRNHGGKHSQQCPEVLEKARATWLEKYGVDNPSKCEEVKARIKDVWLGKYGVPFPPQSLWVNRSNAFPNELEREVDFLSPDSVVYAGDGSYWVRHAGASRSRNPDFVVLKRKQVQAYREGVNLNDLRTSAVIEVFGDYWHGPQRTGQSRAAHKAEVVRYYAQCGVVCLVLWESEVKRHPKRVAERIKRFLEKWRQGAYRGIRQNAAGENAGLLG